MSAATLPGFRILIVEDEYLLADDLARAFCKVGAVVVGPVASVRAALALIASGPGLHGAILDVNLGGETVYPVADALSAEGVPYIFATGYDVADLLPNYQNVPRCAKPVNITALIPILSRTVK